MDIVNLIQNLGFPIACVIACGWFINKQSVEVREDSLKREERMYSQFDKFSESLNSFNETLIRIDSRLGQVEEKLDVK